jgi:membrane protease YdiL (CAAX protease family)
VFRNNVWLALIYPSIGFALWHFALQSIVPFEGSGGKISLVIAAGVLGLMWRWAPLCCNWAGWPI